VSSEWFHKPREVIESDFFPFFKADIAEVYIFDLRDTNGGLVRGSIVVIMVSNFEKERHSYCCYSVRNSLKRYKERSWMPIKYRISSDRSSRYFSAKQATGENTSALQPN